MIGFIMSPWHRDVKLETRLINLISAQLVREKRVQIPPPLQGKCKSQKKEEPQIYHRDERGGNVVDWIKWN